MGRFCHTASLVAFAFCIAGCGKQKTLYPAHGKVVDAAGKPLDGAVVYFNPVDKPDETVHKPAGMADQDGRFTLTTYRENDGAPAGEYVVTLEWKPVRKSVLDPDLPDRLAGKFRDAAKSTIKKTIVKGDNDLEIVVP